MCVDLFGQRAQNVNGYSPFQNGIERWRDWPHDKCIYGLIAYILGLVPYQGILIKLCPFNFMFIISKLISKDLKYVKTFRMDISIWSKTSSLSFVSRQWFGIRFELKTTERNLVLYFVSYINFRPTRFQLINPIFSLTGKDWSFFQLISGCWLLMLTLIMYEVIWLPSRTQLPLWYRIIEVSSFYILCTWKDDHSFTSKDLLSLFICSQKLTYLQVISAKSEP